MRKPAICCLSVLSAMFCLVFSAANAATYKLTPVADTYVYANTGDTNYGLDQGIASGTGPTTVYHNYFAYLRFDLTGIPAKAKITSAALHLYQYLGTAPWAPAGTNVIYVADDSWTETGLTWNNQPFDKYVGLLASNPDPGSYIGWSTWDLSVTESWNPNTDRVLSLVLEETQSTVQSHTWYSKDYTESSLLPYLTITTSTASDSDGDGMADQTVWRPGNGVWYTIPSSSPVSYSSTPWGTAGDIPVAGDYDGDGKSDVAVWRPGNGTWYMRPSGTPGSYNATKWGTNNDIPVPGDYDGDGKSDMAVWRPAEGTWYIRPSSSPSSYTTTTWGISTDVPVAGDYDGDGITDLSVWRPGTGNWFIYKSSNPGSYTIVRWGVDSDIPVPGDFDGDGKTDISVWRPANGVWYVRPSNAGGYTITAWGTNGDTPVSGDYDGDGKSDLVVWRPGNGTWYIRPSGTPGSYSTTRWGTVGDVPVSAITSILKSMP